MITKTRYIGEVFLKKFLLKLSKCNIQFSYLADPGKARGCSINSLVINSLIQSVSLFLPQLYGGASPKRLEIGVPVIK